MLLLSTLLVAAVLLVPTAASPVAQLSILNPLLQNLPDFLNLGRPNWRGSGRSAGSPEYTWLFENALPIPEVAQPLFTETVNGIPIQYFETTIEPFQQQIYPNLGPANLIGYGER
jgi:hypothetical protein